MDFRQLVSFVEITKQQSFTKAAEVLYLSQPTLTGHIQALETELGTVLFNRLGKRVTLTKAGELLYHQAINILNLREQAIYSLSEYQGKLQGELEIAASTVVQNYLLPSLLTAFNEKYPEISFELKQYDSEKVMEAIFSGSVDFGFVGTSSTIPELDSIKLCSDELILITSPNSELGRRQNALISVSEVKAEKFIMREKGSATRERFTQALIAEGLTVDDLRIVAWIESPNTIKRCVREGLGVAVLSERAVREELEQGLLKCFRFSDLNLKRDFYLLKHKNRVLDPVSRAFLHFTRQYFS